MTPRDLQFDLRKNPDSSRVHGLRVAVTRTPNAEQKESQCGKETPPSSAARVPRSFKLPLSNTPSGTTEGTRDDSGRPTGQVHGSLRQVVGADSGRLLTVEEVAALLHVPVSWVYGRMRKRSLERLPAYRLGKYWRFREDEIHAWLKRQCGAGHSA